MRFFQTLAVAFSMYSVLPMPHFDWNEKNMKYAMAAFPLIGLVIGLAEVLSFALCAYLNLPGILRGCILCVLPILLTGGIHLDGYCDTCDALASHKSAEQKQAILKDPHIGAFAAIRLGVYLLVSFALWCTLPMEDILPMGLCFCISRCLSGLSICNFPLAKNTGLAHTFSTAADRKKTTWILTLLMIGCAAGVIALGGIGGGIALDTAGIVFAVYYSTARRQFGGLSGDLAGWFLQKCELWMLFAFVAWEMVGKLL